MSALPALAEELYRRVIKRSLIIETKGFAIWYNQTVIF